MPLKSRVIDNNSKHELPEVPHTPVLRPAFRRLISFRFPLLASLPASRFALSQCLALFFSSQDVKGKDPVVSRI